MFDYLKNIAGNWFGTTPAGNHPPEPEVVENKETSLEGKLQLSQPEKRGLVQQFGKWAVKNVIVRGDAERLEKEKNDIIFAARTKIYSTKIGDEQFGQLVDLVDSLATDAIPEMLKKSELGGIISGAFGDQYITNLVRSTLYKTLGNLAEEVVQEKTKLEKEIAQIEEKGLSATPSELETLKKNRLFVSNFDKQPSLINVLFHLYRRQENKLTLTELETFMKEREALLSANQGKESKESLKHAETFFQNSMRSFLKILVPKGLDELDLPGILKYKANSLLTSFASALFFDDQLSITDYIHEEMVKKGGDYLFSIYKDSPESFLSNLKMIDGGTTYFSDLLDKEGLEKRLTQAIPGDTQNEGEFFMRFSKVLAQDVAKELPSYIENKSSVIENMIDSLLEDVDKRLVEIYPHFRELSKEAIKNCEKNPTAIQQLGISKAKEIEFENQLLIRRGLKQFKEHPETIEDLFKSETVESQKDAVKSEKNVPKPEKEDSEKKFLRLFGVRIGGLELKKDQQAIAIRALREYKKIAFDPEQKASELINRTPFYLKPDTPSYVQELLKVLDKQQVLSEKELLNCLERWEYGIKDPQTFIEWVEKEWNISVSVKQKAAIIELTQNGKIEDVVSNASVEFDEENSEIFEDIDVDENELSEFAKELSRDIQFIKEARQKRVDSVLTILDSEKKLVVSPEKEERLLKLLAQTDVTAKEISSLFSNTPMTEQKMERIQEFLRTLHRKDEIETLNSLFKGLASGHPKIQSFTEDLTEGFFLKVFTMFFEKNPPPEGKDLRLFFLEKFSATVSNSWEEVSSLNTPTHIVSQNITEKLLKEMLGVVKEVTYERKGKTRELDSVTLVDDLNWISSDLKKIIFSSVDKMVEAEIKKVRYSLEAIEKRINAAKSQEEVLEEEQKAIPGQISESLVEFTLNRIIAKELPSILTSSVGQEKGVNMVAGFTDSWMEGLLKDNFETAAFLKDKTNLDPKLLKEFAKERLGNAESFETFAFEKELVQDLTVMSLTKPVHEFIQGAVDLEMEKGDALKESIVIGATKELLAHLRLNNEAKKIAAKREDKKILHKDIVEASESRDIKLNPAFPKQLIDFAETLRLINERIGDPKFEKESKVLLQQKFFEIIKKEGVAEVSVDKIVQIIDDVYIQTHNVHLSEEKKKALKQQDATGATLTDFLRADSDKNVSFRKTQGFEPRGEKLWRAIVKDADKLSLIAPELRPFVDDMGSKTLMPMVLQSITESVLNPQFILQIVVDSAEGAITQMNAPVTPSQEEPKAEDVQVPNELSQLCGEIIAEMLNTLELPNGLSSTLIKGFIYDKNNPEKVDPKNAKMLGSILLGSLRKGLIADTLKDQLYSQAGIKKDAEGGLEAEELVFTEIAKEKSKEEIATEKANLEERMRALPKRFIKAQASNYIRSLWVNAHDSFNKKIESHFGKISLEFKQILDKCFHFIFFTIIGSILEFLSRPFREALLDFVVGHLKLEENMENILGLFTHVPDDQQSEGVEHSYLAESLLLNLTDVIIDSVEKLSSSQVPQETE